MLKTFPVTRCFATAFCSGDHSPKSDAVADASCGPRGLYARHWMASPWLYRSTPSPLSVQMITVLSAAPDAKFLPSRA